MVKKNLRAQIFRIEAYIEEQAVVVCRLLDCGGGGSGRDNDGDLQLTQSGHPTVKAVVFSCNLQMGYDLTGPVS